MKPKRPIPADVGEPVPGVPGLAVMEAAFVCRRQAQALRTPLYILVPLAGWLAWPTGVAPPPVAGEPGKHAAQLDSRLDPNTAQWWELTALPRIGDTLAQRIIAYRTTYREEHAAENAAGNTTASSTASSSENGTANGDVPVFGSAADLQRVRGIGSKTVARLAAHLVFPTDRAKPGSPQPEETPLRTPPGL